MAEESPKPQSPQEIKEDKDALETVKLKEIYEASIKDAIDVKPEEHKELKPILQRIADENSAVLLAFIAPLGGKKVSPYGTAEASIKTSEELGIDKAILDIKTLLEEREITEKPNLILVVNSPGGYVTSSYVISKMIRDNFNKIKVFIPYKATSGGTLLALTGNEIIMGEMSRLSPIDTQLGYKGETVSAQSYRRAIERFEEYFKDKNPYEAPYVWKTMADKFDPILREEWDTTLIAIWRYLYKILKQADYDDKAISWAAYNLIFTNYPHDFVIDRERAEQFLDSTKIKKDTEYPFIWNAMKTWFSIYFLKEEGLHFIRYVVNNKKAE